MNINSLDVLKKCRIDNDYMGQVLLKNESVIWFVIEKYLGGVDNVVYFNNLDRDDLKQVGYIGMIKAIQDFNENMEVNFMTYAVLKVRGEIGNYLRSKGKVIRVTRDLHDLRAKIATLEKSKGFLTNKEISEILKVNLKTIEELRLSENMFFYLDESYNYHDTEFNCKDWIIDERVKIEENSNLKVDFYNFSKNLKKLHRDILYLTTKGYGQRKVATILNISQSYVSRELIKIKNKFIKYVK